MGQLRKRHLKYGMDTIQKEMQQIRKIIWRGKRFKNAGLSADMPKRTEKAR
jgi:hypothetical protein